MSKCQAVASKAFKTGSCSAKKCVYEHSNVSFPKEIVYIAKISAAFAACARCVQLPGTCELFLGSQLYFHKKAVTFGITIALVSAP